MTEYTPVDAQVLMLSPEGVKEVTARIGAGGLAAGKPISVEEAMNRMRFAMDRFAYAMNGGAPDEPTPIYDQLVAELAAPPKPPKRTALQRLADYLGLTEVPRGTSPPLSIFEERG